MASINSLLDIDEERGVELNARDLLAEKGKDKKVVIISHFPFVDGLRGISRDLKVIEKNFREGDLTEEQADVFLPEADVVGVTGSALTNHTMDRLLSMCNPPMWLYWAIRHPYRLSCLNMARMLSQGLCLLTVCKPSAGQSGHQLQTDMGYNAPHYTQMICDDLIRFAEAGTTGHCSMSAVSRSIFSKIASHEMRRNGIGTLSEVAVFLSWLRPKNRL
ncbi:MAG: Rossmann-like domain-containing protein [Halobacteriota archaeon]